MSKNVFIVIAFITIFILLVFFLQKPPNPIGLFVTKSNINTIDSLWLIDGGIYKRSIYSAENKELLFSNESKWEYEKGRLLFKDFFPNDDEPLKKGYDFMNLCLTFSVPLEKSFGREVFDYNEATATYRFYKPYFHR